MCLIVMLLVGTAIPIHGAEDEPSSWAKEEVYKAIENGHVPEWLQNNYQQPITRQEFAELFVTAIIEEINHALLMEEEIFKYRRDFDEISIDLILSRISTTEYFTDTDSKYVKVANILGIVNGVGNHKFNPEGLITREQVCVMFINHLQTTLLTHTRRAELWLSDLDDASPWAKEAVARAYSKLIMNGVKNPVHDENDILIEQGYFDMKGNLTREQAIAIVTRLGRNGLNELHDLILRGYVAISLDYLMMGFDIDGDTIKLRQSDWDAKYSKVKWLLRNVYRSDYADRYNASELSAIVLMPLAAENNMLEREHMDKVLSGQQTFYDYKLFTIEHNKDGYMAIVTKTGNYGYMAATGLTLYYGPYNEHVVKVLNDGSVNE